MRILIPLVPALLAAGVAAAADQRTCLFEQAYFQDGGVEPAEWQVIIAASDKTARIRVVGSGEWDGTRSTTGGADILVFHTTPATETMTIGAGGEALWQIDYDDDAPATKAPLVIAFAGMCEPWRPQ
ncbi:hypothetical protein [Pseudoroseicyclus tamaricis]|uniref:Uncharacterized protein n=2 Tax=Pseudoroseicyclus tamaricis TaxID=2705421 RepID=A0A6B2K2S6_9RHOB|nr:hypothetical protein [Pseudoroseicyclus tamaricis]NDV00776.1 hypothetical protein [Pseudoroseicyclus tamaricis]